MSGEVTIETELATSSEAPDHVIGGTLLGLAAALGYTMTNICLRGVVDCDAVWVSCFKAIPTVLMTLPYVGYRLYRRQMLWTTPQEAACIVATAVVAQMAGNVLFQWSLGIVGLAITVPVTLSCIIIGSACLGRFFLRESVTLRTMASILLMLIAIFVLSLGASDAYEAVQRSRSAATGAIGQGSVLLGIVASCVAGFAYSLLSAAIRWSAARGTPLPSILFLVGVVGTLGLGTMAMASVGYASVAATSWTSRGVMLLAGVLNAVAFLSLALAMRWSGIVYVNLLNGSQAAMAALFGVLFFHEALTAALCVGVLLTVVGLVNLQRRRRDPD